MRLLISQNKWEKGIFTFFLFFLGLALPFLIAKYVPYYSSGDVAIFRYWADCLESYSHKIYLECKTNPNYPLPNALNYPVMGLTLSAGTISFIRSIFGTTQSNTVDSIFRSYLAFFDFFNFLLFTWLANLMRFRLPISIGLILLIIPSTLVGGALWGQIDGISLFFCLLSTISFFKSWSIDQVDFKNTIGLQNGLWLLFGVMNFSLYILTKQLSVFSLPFFLLCLLITVWKFLKYFRYRGIFWVLLSLGLFIFSFRYIDTLFEIPKRFHNSSYFFVWTGGGSNHAENISGNGFNLWMFLGRDMWSSSRITFPVLWDHGVGKFFVSPYNAGMLLYLIFIAFLLFTGFRVCWLVLQGKAYINKRANADVYLLSLLCFFLGLSHLGFNVLLTGTHERYLYLGYPFLLIAVTWFCVNKFTFSWQSTVFCFFAASAYGFFVFSIIGPLPGILFPLRRHEFLASIHLFLLLFLLERWVQVWRLSEMTGRVKQQIRSGCIPVLQKNDQ